MNHQVPVEFRAQFLEILFYDDDLHFEFALNIHYPFIFTVNVKTVLLQVVKLFPYLMLQQAKLLIHF